MRRRHFRPGPRARWSAGRAGSRRGMPLRGGRGEAQARNWTFTARMGCGLLALTRPVCATAARGPGEGFGVLPFGPRPAAEAPPVAPVWPRNSTRPHRAGLPRYRSAARPDRPPASSASWSRAGGPRGRSGGSAESGGTSGGGWRRGRMVGRGSARQASTRNGLPGPCERAPRRASGLGPPSRAPGQHAKEGPPSRAYSACGLGRPRPRRKRAFGTRGGAGLARPREQTACCLGAGRARPVEHARPQKHEHADWGPPSRAANQPAKGRRGPAERTAFRLPGLNGAGRARADAAFGAGLVEEGGAVHVASADWAASRAQSSMRPGTGRARRSSMRSQAEWGPGERAPDQHAEWPRSRTPQSSLRMAKWGPGERAQSSVRKTGWGRQEAGLRPTICTTAPSP